MEWVLLSFTLLLSVFGATGSVLYYFHRFYGQYAHLDKVSEEISSETELQIDHALRRKQLDVFSEIACLIGNVKSVLDYTSGEETLRQWKESMMYPLREILRKSYEWSLFLPGDLKDLPMQYASQLARSLSRLDTISVDELDAYANVIDDIKRKEHEAAHEFQQKIRSVLNLPHVSPETEEDSGSGKAL